jgi:hypothetical protein
MVRVIFLFLIRFCQPTVNANSSIKSKTLPIFAAPKILQYHFTKFTNLSCEVVFNKCHFPDFLLMVEIFVLITVCGLTII